MTPNYSIPGKVIIWMDDYTKGILNKAPMDMDGVVLTLAAEHLFEVHQSTQKPHGRT
jgi:hypothetical protein